MTRTETSSGRSRGPRTFLFLQGLASPFFAELGRALMARGHLVRRINIALGDDLFWPLPATGYRGTLSGWRKHLSGYLAEEAVTDIVLFGDCRPYHRVAISLAAHRNIQVHVFEEGYLRPNWITVEQGGVNGYSSLPRDPADVMRLAQDLSPPVEEQVRSSFTRRAVWDVAYNAANLVGRPLYPYFRRHRPNHIALEYLGWLRKLARARDAARQAEIGVEAALAHPGGFFLVPLQLDSDYQIRVHSGFPDLEAFLDKVLSSFARHAPPAVQILVKVHPLDNGLVNRLAQVDRLAKAHGIRSRVRAVDGGHLPTLLQHTHGVVVINSTVGLTSVEVGRPTIALGDAIYDMAGLTCQDGLDRFWTEPAPPDPDLIAAFRRLVIARTQINGGYFGHEAIAMAVGPAADRLEEASPLPGFRSAFDRGLSPDAAAAELFGRPQPAE